MNIGIFGGTFNPIHVGHLIGAEQARSEGKLDEVWFMPSASPPHKSDKNILSWDYRYKMTELAIEDNTYFKMLGIEHDRKGPSYTYDTIQIIKQRFPEHHFSFILGTDMVLDLPNWHQTESLAKLVSFIGLKRPGYELNDTDKAKLAAFSIQWISQIEVGVSSTQVRERRQNSHSIKYLVPEKVFHFIEENKLYEG